MSKKTSQRTSVSLVGSALTVVLCIPMSVSAFVMTGADYRVQFDSITMGGGSMSSENYATEASFGEAVVGGSEGEVFAVTAGFQAVLNSYIAMNAIEDVTLLEALGGLSGGVSDGTTTVSVRTDNQAGYQLMLAGTTGGSLVGGDTLIPAYTASSAVPDRVFLVAPGDARFGLSVSGADAVDSFKHDGLTCGGGTNEPGFCWIGVPASTTVVARGGATLPSGTDTTLHFRVGVGSNTNLQPGEYVATTTVTVLAL